MLLSKVDNDPFVMALGRVHTSAKALYDSKLSLLLFGLCMALMIGQLLT